MKPAFDEAPASVPSEPRHEWYWPVWAMLAAFGCYFCMYAFRKPFTAAGFSDTSVWGLGFKTVLVTSQVAGYTLSKFLGIKVIAEMPPHRRAWTLLQLVLLAEGALLLFGLVPRPWNAVCLFANGLPLGMVFGLVLGALEGRRMTEALAAGLCASFILADGVMKTVGAWLLQRRVPEDWMPSAAGALFLFPLAVCVVMLHQIPVPTERDIAARTRRSTMNGAERWSFLQRYALGLLPLVVIFLAVTIVRSIRADFAPEIWKDLLGIAAAPGTFTTSEIYVALGVLAVNGSACLIADNRRAFFVSLATCGLGFGLLTLALVGLRGELLNPFMFMVLVGLGMYLPYVAFHTTVFERMLGMTREPGNVGFLMYVADSIGYLGYVTVMIARNFGPAPKELLSLLITVCWATIGVSIVCLVVSWLYFSQQEATSVAAAEGIA